jgi:hypothetical protein
MSAPSAGQTILNRPSGERTAARATWRVVLLAGRAEAGRLCRSPLVWAGLVISGALIVWNSRALVPQWTVWDVQIGSSLLVLAGAVLVAAHLAVSRVNRDGLQDLYESYPVSASARAAAQLLGLVGPVFMAAVLTGAAVLWLDLLGPVGSPRLAVLVQGVLLVGLAGTVGAALARLLPHPVTGILAVAVLSGIEADLLMPSGAPLQIPGETVWLFPWTQPWLLGSLPGPTPVVPPEAHLLWLAALAAFAAVVAMWRVTAGNGSPRRSAVIALAAAVSLTAAGWSGWAQTRPLPAAAEDSLSSQITQAARTEQCVRWQRVRYCFYPEFRGDVARWAVAVNAVLGRLPSFPAGTLVVRQVVDANVLAYPLISGSQAQPARLTTAIDNYLDGQADNLRLIPGSSVPPVYVDLSWGAGSAVGGYQLSLSLQTAWWVAGLPTTWQPVASTGGLGSLTESQTSCLPAGQAREAIALWLAASATPATRAAFAAALDPGPAVTEVDGRLIASYVQPQLSGYVPALQFTAQGAALAQAMLRLPEPRVLAVLSARWPGWLNPKATDAQLAAALQLPLPTAPLPAPPGLPTKAAHNLALPHPVDPVCT